MPNDFKYDVFLSHSAKDKPVVRELANRLKKDNLRVWFDEWELKPGDSIPARIEDGLANARVLVLCMSANAFGSDWAQFEAGTFRFRDPLNQERRFILLRLDDAPIKDSLTQFLYINWLPKNREQDYAKLLETCRPPAKASSAEAQATPEQVEEKMIILNPKVIDTDEAKPAIPDIDETVADSENALYAYFRASTKHQDDSLIARYSQTTIEDHLATCNQMIHCLAGFDTVFLMSPNIAAEQARQIDEGWLNGFGHTHEMLCLAAAARKIDIEPYRSLVNAAYSFWKGTADTMDTEADLKRLFSPGIGALYNLKRALMVESVAEQIGTDAKAGRQRMTAGLVIKAKEAEGKFDVFLSHNAKDKAAVEKIAKQLLKVGIRPWLDKWNLAPGDTISEALEQAIRTIPCAALCFGPGDIGKWHIMEIRAYVEKWASGDARMIPVILPKVEQTPELPLFVRQTLWVDMREWENDESDGFYRLVCGILGRVPGDSPMKRFGVRNVAEWQGMNW